MHTSSIWRNKNFFYLIVGQTISTFGSSITSLALPWLILDITKSSLQMGLIVTLGIVPYLILALPAGVWADKYNRKKLMLISNIGKTISISLIPLTYFIFDDISIILIYFVRICMGIFDAIFDASYGACLPSIVSKNQLKQANSIMQTGIAISNIAGPAVSGLLISLIGAASTIFLDMFTYIISVITLLVIKSDFSAVNAKQIKDQGLIKDIVEGLIYIWNQRTVRFLTILSLLTNISSSLILVVLLYRINVELEVSAQWSGIILSGISIGALIGSLSFAFISRFFSFKQFTCFSLLLQALSPFIIIFTNIPIIMMLGTVLFGISGVLWNINVVSLRQTIIPNTMLGRAGASIKMVSIASTPVGSSLGGALAQVFSSIIVFILGGVINLINFGVALNFPLTEKEKLINTKKEKG